MGEIFVRKRRNGLSVTLVTTFVLGVAIGFALCYVWLSMRPQGVPGGSPQPVASAPADEEITPEPDQPSVTPAEETPVEAQPVVAQPIEAEKPLDEEPEGVWPGRHLFIAVEGATITPEAVKMIREIKPGGVVLREENFAPDANGAGLVLALQKAVNLGRGPGALPLCAAAQEGGPRNPLKVEDSPAASDLAKSGDAISVREAGLRCGTEAVSRGIPIVLAPVLNVFEEGVAGADMAVRTFGTDQQTVCSLGLTFVKGVTDAGAIAVGKYFPGLGTKMEEGEGLVINHDIPRLAEIMYPFNEAVNEGIPGVLVGHVAVPELDTQRPERPASLSPVFMQKILRGHWDYEGVVLADDVSGNAPGLGMPAEEAAVAALAAGCDAVLLLDPDPERVRAVCAAIEAAVSDETLSVDALAASRRRLDEWQVVASDALPALQDVPEPVEAGKPSEAPEEAPVEAEGPAEEPAVEESVAEEPAGEAKPEEPAVEEKAAEEESVETPEDEAKPAEEAPAAPAEEEPAKEEPAKEEPAKEEPAKEEPAKEEPAEEEPAEEEPAKEEPAKEEPAKEEPAKEEPAKEGPAEEEPAKEEPAKEEPAKEEPAKEEPAKEGPAKEEPAKEEPAKEEKAPAAEDEAAAELTPVAPSEPESAAEEEGGEGPPPGTELVIHEITRGETLSKLSRQYGVPIADIMKWNEMDEPTIKFGFKLKIYKPTG